MKDIVADAGEDQDAIKMIYVDEEEPIGGKLIFKKNTGHYNTTHVCQPDRTTRIMPMF